LEPGWTNRFREDLDTAALLLLPDDSLAAVRPPEFGHYEVESAQPQKRTVMASLKYPSTAAKNRQSD